MGQVNELRHNAERNWKRRCKIAFGFISGRKIDSLEKLPVTIIESNLNNKMIFLIFFNLLPKGKDTVSKIDTF